MRTLTRSLRWLAPALLLVAVLAGCGKSLNPYDGAILDTEIADGVSTQTAGSDIRYGTWMFANSYPHKVGERCWWTVTVGGSTGDVLRRSEPDTGNAVQSVYVGRGETLNVAHCGPGGWLEFDDLTKDAE